ncbi:MAG: hypothetical protein EOP50_07605, partial [Sphingobacteriales bacterium]
ISLVSEGLIDLKPLVTHRFTLDQAKEACENMASSFFMWDNNARICRKKAKYICEDELKMKWTGTSDTVGNCSAALSACSAVPVFGSGTTTLTDFSSYCGNTDDYCKNYQYLPAGLPSGTQCYCVGSSTGSNKMGRSCNTSITPTQVATPLPTVTPAPTITPTVLPSATPTPTVAPTPSGTPAPTIAGNIFVSATGSCAIMPDRTVRCWGRNGWGSVGDGTTVERHTSVPVPGLTNIIAGAGGDNGNCALQLGGQVFCWGAYPGGQNNTPIAITGASDAVSLSISGGTGCFVTTSGQVKCFGNNNYGQLGNGTTNNSSSPVLITSLSSMLKVASGSESTCALRSDGAVFCWGKNDDGELGDGTNSQRTTPTPVSGLSNGVIDIAGNSNLTCALMTDNSTRCWGRFRWAITTFNTPQNMNAMSGMKTITAGNQMSCGLTLGNQVKCWGSNTHGAPGNGNIMSPPFVNWHAAVTVAISDVHQITSSPYHTCAIKKDCSVQCWGLNDGGYLGDGTTTPSATPRTVVGINLCAP